MCELVGGVENHLVPASEIYISSELQLVAPFQPLQGSSQWGRVGGSRREMALVIRTARHAVSSAALQHVVSSAAAWMQGSCSEKCSSVAAQLPQSRSDALQRHSCASYSVQQHSGSNHRVAAIIECSKQAA